MGRRWGAMLAVAALAAAARAAPEPEPGVVPAPGPVPPATVERLLLLDGARAGARLVCVGDRGAILYSDDAGRSWTRAVSPEAPLLTAVDFADERHGWAVGHDAVVLATADGGATWTRQSSAPEENRPLLDVLFLGRDTGFAIGAYGAFLETTDGGAHWTARRIVEDDRHLNAIVRLTERRLLIVGEAGTLLLSDDAGRTWAPIPSPYKGSYFGALVAGDGAVLAFGLRGRLYRSGDGAATWTQVGGLPVATLMGGTLLADGTVVVAGAGGNVLASRDHGLTFAAVPAGTTRPWSKPLAGPPGALLLLGEAGARIVPLPAARP